MKSIRKYNPDDNFVFVFENGKGVRISSSVYETKTNRNKLTGAFSDASKPVGIFYESAPFELMLISNVGRAIVISTSDIPVKATRNSIGVALFTLRNGQKISECRTDFEGKFADIKKYRKNKLPAAGVKISEYDADSSQLKV